MAGVKEPAASDPPAHSSFARSQYAAVLEMRWRMLLNSMRSWQGRFEAGARVFATAFFGIVWLAVGIGCGFAAYQIAANNLFRFLPVMLWLVLVAWQTFPILLSASQESVDFNFLLRFPVRFRSYVLLYLCFGIFDPASMLGGISLLGVWTGTVLGRPGLILWITLTLAVFALFNFLLTRMIFAWIERWLAQRKTREILGVLIFVFLISFQFMNPALRSHRGAHSIDSSAFQHTLKTVQSVQGVFPPGLAGGAFESAGDGHYSTALLLVSGLALCAAVAGGLLTLRLRAEFRGDSFGEAPKPFQPRIARVRAELPRAELLRDAAAPGTRSRGMLSGPVGAMVIKDVHILLRSGVMLFGLFTPLVFVFVMGGPMLASSAFHFGYAFPLAVAYGFLPLTRQFCNSLGTEGAGIQLYFLSPTPFRSVMLGKNLLQIALFCIELVLVATIALLRFGVPRPTILIATFCWVLFALPANLAAGNILSIVLAYRMTLTRLSREQGSIGNGLLSLGIQLLIFAAGGAIYLPMALLHHAELAAPIFLVLAAGSWMLWLRILANVDVIAARRRDALVFTLVKSA